MRIALLEDDVEQADLICAWLRDAGHNVRHFETSRDFLRGVLRDSNELLILDWMLPRMDGLEVMQRVRESLRNYTPILFITARDDEDDVVKALESGADDYMAKPLSKREFLARIVALGRRGGGYASEQVADVEPYEIDLERKSVRFNGETVELTHREFDLAAFMFKHVGSVISRAHILESIWGMHGADLNTRTVDTHISRLRKKLHINESNGWQLSAIYQHGYRLERVDVPAAADKADD